MHGVGNLIRDPAACKRSLFLQFTRSARRRRCVGAPSPRLSDAVSQGRRTAAAWHERSVALCAQAHKTLIEGLDYVDGSQQSGTQR